MCPLYLGQLKEQLPVCREGRCQDSRCELERAPTKEALLPFAGIVSAASSNRSTIQLRWNDVCGLMRPRMPQLLLPVTCLTRVRVI